jgi:hypothetical protein
MLGDSAVFLEHWQSLAGSAPTATAAAADVCQWLQRSLADVVSPGSIARGLERARQAVGEEAASAGVRADGTLDAVVGAGEEQEMAVLDEKSSTSASTSAVSRLLLSMTIVTTLHCRRGELIFQYMIAAAAAAAAVAPKPAAASHPTGTVSYRDVQLHLPVTDLGFTVESTLMEFSSMLVIANRSGGGVPSPTLILQRLQSVIFRRLKRTPASIAIHSSIGSTSKAPGSCAQVLLNVTLFCSGFTAAAAMEACRFPLDPPICLQVHSYILFSSLNP